MLISSVFPGIALCAISELYLSILFALPLLKTSQIGSTSSPRIRRLALRSLVATTVSILTSGLNIGLLENFAEEPELLCIASCGAFDVTVNALIIFLVRPLSPCFTPNADA